LSYTQEVYMGEGSWKGDPGSVVTLVGMILPSFLPVYFSNGSLNGSVDSTPFTNEFYINGKLKVWYSSYNHREEFNVAHVYVAYGESPIFPVPTKSVAKSNTSGNDSWKFHDRFIVRRGGNGSKSFFYGEYDLGKLIRFMEGVSKKNLSQLRIYLVIPDASYMAGANRCSDFCNVHAQNNPAMVWR